MADPGGAPTYEFAKFPKNCMKLKEFGPPGGRVPRVPLRSATGGRNLKIELVEGNIFNYFSTTEIIPGSSKGKLNSINYYIS